MKIPPINDDTDYFMDIEHPLSVTELLKLAFRYKLVVRQNQEGKLCSVTAKDNYYLIDHAMSWDNFYEKLVFVQPFDIVRHHNANRLIYCCDAPKLVQLDTVIHLGKTETYKDDGSDNDVNPIQILNLINQLPNNEDIVAYEIIRSTPTGWSQYDQYVKLYKLADGEKLPQQVATQNIIFNHVVFEYQQLHLLYPENHDSLTEILKNELHFDCAKDHEKVWDIPYLKEMIGPYYCHRKLEPTTYCKMLEEDLTKKTNTKWSHTINLHYLHKGEWKENYNEKEHPFEKPKDLVYHADFTNQQDHFHIAFPIVKFLGVPMGYDIQESNQCQENSHLLKEDCNRLNQYICNFLVSVYAPYLINRNADDLHNWPTTLLAKLYQSICQEWMDQFTLYSWMNPEIGPLFFEEELYQELLFSENLPSKEMFSLRAFGTNKQCKALSLSYKAKLEQLTKTLASLKQYYEYIKLKNHLSTKEMEEEELDEYQNNADYLRDQKIRYYPVTESVIDLIHLLFLQNQQNQKTIVMMTIMTCHFNTKKTWDTQVFFFFIILFSFL